MREIPQREIAGKKEDRQYLGTEFGDRQNILIIFAEILLNPPHFQWQEKNSYFRKMTKMFCLSPQVVLDTASDSV
jgi:hypothetical protein